MVEDGDHLHDIGDVDRPDGQVEPWRGEKIPIKILKKLLLKMQLKIFMRGKMGLPHSSRLDDQDARKVGERT